MIEKIKNKRSTKLIGSKTRGDNSNRIKQTQRLQNGSISSISSSKDKKKSSPNQNIQQNVTNAEKIITNNEKKLKNENPLKIIKVEKIEGKEDEKVKEDAKREEETKKVLQNKTNLEINQISLSAKVDTKITQNKSASEIAQAIPEVLRKQGTSTLCSSNAENTCPCNTMEDIQQISKKISYCDRKNWISVERMNELRKKAQDAVKQHKIFTIRGCFFSIRSALVSRGWVEKLDIHRRQNIMSNGVFCQVSFEDLTNALPKRRPGESRRQYLIKCERNIMSRFLEHMPIDFLWTARKEKCDWIDQAKNPSMIINKFHSVPFTSKEGLCTQLRDFHWFYEDEVSQLHFPRCYNVWSPEELNEFIENFRLTACIGFLKYIVDKFQIKDEVFIENGKIPFNSIEFAFKRCNEFIDSRNHYDIDYEEVSPRIWDHDWDVFLTNHHILTHEGAKIHVDSNRVLTPIIKQAERILENLKNYWPQFNLDGYLNIWIVKPANKCRGRGIYLMNNLRKVLNLVNPSTSTKGRYVVQKYIERPLIIHGTKFDIRQWFLVTSVHPLTIWMYKESYLRFSSQEYNLKNYHESVHLTNHAVQKKYQNGNRDKRLPNENMWDCYTFQAYLRQIGQHKMWDERIYSGMKQAITGAMLASQDNMDRKANTFELFGADFMITEDFYPWLLEINSSPDLGATTSVTARMCPQCLEDVIKVVIDRRLDFKADTGSFEMIYRQNVPPAPAYMGLNLFLKGKQISSNKTCTTFRREKTMPSLYKQSRIMPVVTGFHSMSSLISNSNLSEEQKLNFISFYDDSTLLPHKTIDNGNTVYFGKSPNFNFNTSTSNNHNLNNSDSNPMQLILPSDMTKTPTIKFSNTPISNHLSTPRDRINEKEWRIFSDSSQKTNPNQIITPRKFLSCDPRIMRRTRPNNQENFDHNKERKSTFENNTNNIACIGNKFLCSLDNLNVTTDFDLKISPRSANLVCRKQLRDMLYNTGSSPKLEKSGTRNLMKWKSSPALYSAHNNNNTAKKNQVIKKSKKVKKSKKLQSNINDTNNCKNDTQIVKVNGVFRNSNKEYYSSHFHTVGVSLRAWKSKYYQKSKLVLQSENNLSSPKRQLYHSKFWSTSPSSRINQILISILNAQSKIPTLLNETKSSNEEHSSNDNSDDKTEINYEKIISPFSTSSSLSSFQRTSSDSSIKITNLNKLKNNNSIEFNYENVYKKYKLMVLRAIREKKIFMIYGNYRTIRSALLNRGWLEKLCPGKHGHEDLMALSQQELMKNAKTGNNYETVVISNMLSAVSPNFIWQPKYQENLYDHMYPYRNRIWKIRYYDYTKKDGLMTCIENYHWQHIDNVTQIHSPKFHRLESSDDIEDFQKMYKITYCLSLMNFLKEKNCNNIEMYCDDGVISDDIIRFAINRIKDAIAERNHEDIDIEDSDTENDTNKEKWDTFLKNCDRIINEGSKFKNEDKKFKNLYVTQVNDILAKAEKYWPTVHMDGYLNLWIMKPACQSRGIGILIMKNLSSIVEKAKWNPKQNYIVQKYIERPLLIYKTKFDIRQHVLLTVTENNINIWFYKECYLRFSSREFSLTNLTEAVHLTNNSIQKKYKNGQRSELLPVNNMWTSTQFCDYLKSVVGKSETFWNEKIYSGMKAGIIGIVMACLEEIDVKRKSFELYGCDFLLDENFNPILLEINSVPDMTPSTSVTAKLCPLVLQDLVKVVVDLPGNSEASCGNFECVYSRPWKRKNTYVSSSEFEVCGKKAVFHDTTMPLKKQFMQKLKNIKSKKLKTTPPMVIDETALISDSSIKMSSNTNSNPSSITCKSKSIPQMQKENIPPKNKKKTSPQKNKVKQEKSTNKQNKNPKSKAKENSKTHKIPVSKLPHRKNVKALSAIDIDKQSMKFLDMLRLNSSDSQLTKLLISRINDLNDMKNFSNKGFSIKKNSLSSSIKHALAMKYDSQFQNSNYT